MSCVGMKLKYMYVYIYIGNKFIIFILMFSLIMNTSTTPYMKSNSKFNYVDFYFHFEHPFTCVISGPTMSGKSVFVKNLIRLKENRIRPCPSKVHYYFSEWQPLFDSMKTFVEFKKGLPDLDTYNGKDSVLVIIDDLMFESNNKIGNFFTKGSHHKNLSVIFISQNLFNSNKDQRTINLNSQYLVIFKNPRDILQIQFLGRSILGRNAYEFEQAYREATSKPHGYLLVNLKQNTPDQFRYMTHVLDDHPENTDKHNHQDVFVLSQHEHLL